MTRPRHGLVAIVATALLALTLTSVSPAAADGVASDASSQKQGTYATPATEPAVPDATGSDPAAPPSDEATPDPQPSTPAPDPSPAPEPPAPSPQPTTGSWARDSAGWRYVLSDGTAVAHQVKEIGGVVYAFDATGHIARGWYRGPQGRWYLSSDHGVRTGWQRDGATWYYLGSSGAMATKWLLDGGTWYFMRDSGAMATGWVRDGSHWYHLSSSGAMTTGWLHSGDWYYLDPSSGGAMATGWRSIGGRWSYFDAWDGFWVTNRAGFDADWAYARTLYSPTNYLIVVDTSAPHCMSFYWRDGAWQPHHDWPCSVGAGSTPTVRGTFSIGSRGRSFGSGYTAYWWTQFHHDYLFHSILYHQGTYTVQDGTLGGHVSHGCVRMRFQDAKWIHDNVPSGTRVVIY